AVVLVPTGVGVTAAAVGRRKFGIEFDCLVAVGDGVVVFIFTGVGETAVAVGHRKFAIEFDRLVEVGDGAVVLPLVVVGTPALTVCPRKFGIEFDCFVVVGDGSIVVSLASVGQANGIKIDGSGWVNANQSLEVGLRLCVLPHAFESEDTSSQRVSIL